MIRLRDLAVSRKFYMVFGIAIFFVSAMALVGLLNMLWMVNTSRDVYEDSFVEARGFIKLKADLQDVRRALLTMLSEPDRGRFPHHMQKIRRATVSIDESINSVLRGRGHLDSEGIATVKKIDSVWQSFKETRDDELLPYIYMGRIHDAVNIAMGVQQDRYSKFTQLADSLAQHEKEEAASRQKDIEQRFWNVIRVYLLIIVAGIIVGIILIRYLARDIGARMRAVADGVALLEAGRSDIRLTVTGKDEIGRLESGFNKMSAALSRDKVAQEQYRRALDWNMREQKKKAGKLEKLNENLTRVKQVLSNRNKEMEDYIEQLHEAQRRLREARELAIRSEKMASIGQLAAGVAHEINNPVGFVGSNLTTLSGYVDDFKNLLHRYGELSEKVGDGNISGVEIARGFEEIKELEKEIDIDYVVQDVGNLVAESRDGLERVISIVRGLKDFAHEGDVEMALSDINRCLENAIKIGWNEMKYKAELDKDLGEIPPVPCRKQQINQVFLNIIINALHAIPDKGRIEVRSYTENGHAVVDISDDGIGMTKEVRSRIFDPFFTTKPVGKGTGLGLSIAYGIIVNDHGGSIDVRSKPGEGTTFTVKLPLKHAVSGDAPVKYLQ